MEPFAKPAEDKGTRAVRGTREEFSTAIRNARPPGKLTPNSPTTEQTHDNPTTRYAGRVRRGLTTSTDSPIHRERQRPREGVSLERCNSGRRRHRYLRIRRVPASPSTVRIGANGPRSPCFRRSHSYTQGDPRVSRTAHAPHTLLDLRLRTEDLCRSGHRWPCAGGSNLRKPDRAS